MLICTFTLVEGRGVEHEEAEDAKQKRWVRLGQLRSGPWLWYESMPGDEDRARVRRSRRINVVVEVDLQVRQAKRGNQQR